MVLVPPCLERQYVHLGKRTERNSRSCVDILVPCGLDSQPVVVAQVRTRGLFYGIISLAHHVDLSAVWLKLLTRGYYTRIIGLLGIVFCLFSFLPGAVSDDVFFMLSNLLFRL